jgi:histidinol dehydrogenase
MDPLLGWVARFVAQAEHDLLASAILLTPSQALIEEVEIEVSKHWNNGARRYYLASLEIAAERSTRIIEKRWCFK